MIWFLLFIFIIFLLCFILIIKDWFVFGFRVIVRIGIGCLLLGFIIREFIFMGVGMFVIGFMWVFLIGRRVSVWGCMVTFIIGTWSFVIGSFIGVSYFRLFLCFSGRSLVLIGWLFCGWTGYGIKGMKGSFVFVVFFLNSLKFSVIKESFIEEYYKMI